MNLKVANFICLCLFTSYTNQSAATEISESSLHPDAKKIINIWLESQLDYQQIPYLSVSYVKDQKFVLNESYGHIELEGVTNANSDSISSVCSISKVFTATAIMKLVDQGKLSLDDRLVELLPEFFIKNSGKSNDDIKLVHLLNHTSGLPRDTVQSYWSGPDHNFPTKKELFDSLAKQHRENEVDVVSSYSNVGYALLGRIIEKVSGTSYKVYMEQEIFQPLNMYNSVVEMSENNYGINHTIGYTAINRNGKRNKANFYKTRAMQPATGISSNAEELAKFAMWQFREIDANEPELMSAKSLIKMYQTEHSQVTPNRGLGYEIREDKNGDVWAMHGGMCPGYTSFLQMNTTQKEGYTVVTSANRVRALAYINNLKKVLTKASQITDSPDVEKGFSEYEGFYDLNPWNSEYYIGSWGDDLMLLYLPVDSMDYALYQYKYMDEDTFQLIENGSLKDEVIKFNRDPQGVIVSVNSDGGIHPKIRSSN
ncbi:MAG: beta-lactamase family protein [Thalassotalea sp.]|nr:beta-lactamase family protein [Thalassotalea sp.]